MQDLRAALAAKKAAPAIADNTPAGARLLICISSFDTVYASSIKKYLTGFQQVYVEVFKPELFSELQMFCKSRKITHILTTQLSTLKCFDRFLQGTADSNQGTLLHKDGLSCILVPNLKQIYSVNEGAFMLKHWVHKLLKPESFLAIPAWKWTEVTAVNYDEALEFISECSLVSVDIETEPKKLTLTSCAWAGIHNQTREVRSYVIDFRNWTTPESIMAKWAMLRSFNASKPPKIMQNGQYDAMYFMRFGAPLHNWLFDTYNMMHCMYAELPKRLDFLAQFFLRNARYWKEESSSHLLEYNAKDTVYTLFVFLSMQLEAEDYARTNYLAEFPMVFPCLLCGVEGILVDEEERLRLRAAEVERRDSALKSLRTCLGIPEFNPASPKQVLAMFHAMGFKRATGTDKLQTRSFSEAHPIYARLAENLTKYRKAAKAISTYYDVTLLGQRLLFQLDPGGTETGRLASKSSAFWCGTQIQNQPAYCKSMYLPDQGWMLSEIDGCQAESRCTAYMAEDLTLIDTVENSPDFHCTNASLFFGIPFDQIYQVGGTVDGVEIMPRVLRPDIRKLAKPVNHGANYNMGPDVLADQMGPKMVFFAAKLLNLPRQWGLREICAHLLACFHKAYKNISSVYYPRVIHEIETTGRLVGPTGWTRRTFLQPRKSKLDLNAAVAHGPQSLSVMLVNKAFYAAFKYQLATGSKLFRIKAQIHDSIFFQYRPTAEKEVIEKISSLMRIPVQVHGRTLVIPNDPKYGAACWSDLKD